MNSGARKTNKAGMLLLLYGIFSATQIHLIGFIGISEVAVFAVAPFVYFRDRAQLRKDGYSVYLLLSVCCLLGCVFSGIWNKAYLVDIIKTLAMIYALFAHIVVLHRLLWRDPGQMKWIFLGLAISKIISIFIFQPGSAHNSEAMTNDELIDSVVGYALFWVTLISTWVNLPVRMYYLSTPFWYSVAAPAFCSLYAIFSTSSGRSTFFVTALSVLILIFGRKSWISMRKICNHFGSIAIVLLIASLSLATIYKVGAKQGIFGAAMQEKYEKQMLGRSGFLGILMGGRLEFFIGATAALQHPLIGVGPKAEDREGLVGYFMDKYGTEEDWKAYIGAQKMRLAQGASLSTIPAHSHIVSFWLWCGLPGLIFWIYALYLLYKTLSQNIWVVPQWFGYFALAIPSSVMAIFFSPFGDRTGDILLLTTCLMARAVAKGSIQLPEYMIEEAKNYE